MKKYGFLCWVMVWFTALPAALAMANDVYEFSMLPRYFPKKIHSMIDPLAAHLSREIGLHVNPVLAKDFAEYENRLNSGEIEIGYENPLVYTKISANHEVIAMAVKGEGGDRFRGIIIARPDSGIQTFSDLRHKKIMIVGETSAGGFLSQKLTLAENGIDVETDCQLETASDNKQENVIISVSIGDVDAGFIRESAFNVADPYIQPGTVRIVAPCAWLPNWALSVSRKIPSERKAAIRTAIIGLQENASVLQAMEVSGFKPASDSQYDVIRQVLSH